ncbi:Ig-like domain-containing protein [Brevibacillus fluminis]|uniref:Ig-like domain-containing protein n=1 Tax=Brevibacillus fluminis TaxID=511487 RepID=UPI003F8A14B0
MIRIIALFVCMCLLAQQAVSAYPVLVPASGAKAAVSWGKGLVADTAASVTLTSIQIKGAFAGTSEVQFTVEGKYSDSTTATIDNAAVTWSSSDSNVATVSSGKVTFTGKNGTVKITASYQGQTDEISTTIADKSVLTSIEINTGGKGFAFDPMPVQLSVKGFYDNDLANPVPLTNVSWSTSDPNIATVSSSGLVTFTKINGTVTITAEYQGKRHSVTTTVTGQNDLTAISFNEALAYSTTPVQLTVKGTYSNGTTAVLGSVSWTTNAPDVATVDKGKVTFTGKSGTVTITASYQGKTATATVTVPVTVTAITINESLAYSTTPVQLTVRATYNNGTAQNVSGATWTSSNPSVASVDGNGRVTFTGLNGAATITASYQGKTHSVSTTVNNSLSLISIAIVQSLSYSTTPVALSVNGYYANGSTQPLAGATWTSSNPSVATVNALGQVTFTGANGAVTITASYNGLTNSVSTIVDRPTTVQLVSLAINTPFAYSNYPVQLTLTGVYSDRSTQTLTNASWASSSTAVATVDANGLVTFTGANGSVTITATYNGLNTSVSTTVNRNTVNLTKVTIFGSISYSTTPEKLVALGHYSNNTTEILQNANWSSSNTDVATVNNKGEVTFTGKDGSVTITAEYQGFKDSVSTVVTSGEKPTSISITTYFEYDEDPYPLKLYATYKNGNRVLVDNNAVTWSSDNTSVAKVSTNGTVTFTGKTGRVTITASYKGLTDSVTTKVDSDTVESISIRENLEYDTDTVELTVRVRYNDGSTKVVNSSKVEWSSDNTRVAKVNSKGVVTFTDKEGKVTITAKYEGKTDKVKTTVTASDIRDKERSSSSKGSSGSSSGSGSSSSNSSRKPFASSVIDASSVEWNISTLAKNMNAMRVSDFSDTAYHWARKEIKLARGLNLTKGEPNGTFKPDAFITREEFVALICRAFQINPASYGNTFHDTQNSWAKGYIAALAAKGVVKGNQDGTFKPESNITRAEMVTIISRLLNSRELPDYGSVYFSDTQNHWAKDTISQISRAGLVKGTDYNRFAPEANTTRAEAIVILLRTLRLSPSINSAISSVL